MEEKLLSCCGTRSSCKRGKGSEAAQQPKAHLTPSEEQLEHAEIPME